MGKRKAQEASSHPLVDARAHELRAQVEALARNGADHHQCGGMPSSAAGMGQQGLPQPGCGRGMQMPMLINSIDTGVYLKWSIMLQDQVSAVLQPYYSKKPSDSRARARGSRRGSWCG